MDFSILVKNPEVSVMDLQAAIQKFAEEVAAGRTEIYNEFSLQHELGVFLRQSITRHKVQFERNVSYFGLSKSEFVKREIDIAIFTEDRSSLAATIELKFPRNGQHPEQMFSFCKDVVFAEQLKRAGFQSTYVIIFAEDPLFYAGNQEGIYGYFRGGKELTGQVQKPTGRRDSTLQIQGKYQVRWHPLTGQMKYTVIKAE